MRASAAPAGDRPPPQLPLAQWWSVTLDAPVAAGPVTDGSRVYVSLTSAFLTARDAADGHEIWRQRKNVTAAMAVAGDLLIVASGGAIEALRGAASGASAWILPRTTPAAPLLVADGTLFIVTDTELVVVRAASGEVLWRRAAGGVQIAPAIDGERVYLGANDGRLLALSLKDGAQLWEGFFTGGVANLAAYRGRVYVGAGDKFLYCLDGARKGEPKWQFRFGAIPVGRIAVDDERVYAASLDNVIRGLARESGNMRWQTGLRLRPSFGVYVAGHVVFVPAAAAELQMLYDDDGAKSGSLALPGDAPPGLPPAIAEEKDGPAIYAVTGGLTNEWSLARYARAGDTVLFPFAKLEPLPGLPFLTDPALMPPGNVLQLLLIGDPVLQPLADAGWPIVLRDPPLMPLTTLPGLQLRPLSPVLPVRRGEPGPGG